MIVGRGKSTGFTLMELLITLLILGILSTLAMPSFMQQIKQDRLTNNTNLLSAFYKYSRSEAVKQSKSVQLVTTSDAWLLQADDGTGTLETLDQFSVSNSSIQISYVDRTISSTGELDQAIDILITDNDSSTEDYRFCVLQSGQSWIEEATNTC